MVMPVLAFLRRGIKKGIVVVGRNYLALTRRTV